MKSGTLGAVRACVLGASVVFSSGLPAAESSSAKVESVRDSAAEDRRILRVRKVREARRSRFEAIVRSAAQDYGVREDLIHAVIWVESAYDPDAVSPKGAAGLMQLMPATAERYAVADRFDPKANVAGGTAYLRELEKRYGGDLNLVLAAYNAGEAAVDRHGKRVPPYPETEEFVRRVRAVMRGSGPRCWRWSDEGIESEWGVPCEVRRPRAFGATMRER